jgi:hypothetical protein
MVYPSISLRLSQIPVPATCAARAIRQRLCNNASVAGGAPTGRPTRLLWPLTLARRRREIAIARMCCANCAILLTLVSASGARGRCRSAARSRGYSARAPARRRWTFGGRESAAGLMGMTEMRSTFDPPPTLDPNLSEVRAALEQIRLEVESVRVEYPEMTERQALQEARRRCSGPMIAAANAIDESQQHRTRDRRPPARARGIESCGPTSTPASCSSMRARRRWMVARVSGSESGSHEGPAE